VDQVGGASNAGSETSAALPKPPFWRKLARGFAFVPVGLLMLAFWGWLLGSVGVAIGVVATIGLFAQGYSGEPMFGASNTAGARAAAASATPLTTPKAVVANAPRRRSWWWKVPLALVGAFGALVIVAAIVGPPPKLTDSDATVEKQAAAAPVAKSVASPPPTKKPETLEDRVGAGNVERAGDWVIVRYVPGAVWSPKSYVFGAGQLLDGIGRWAHIVVPGRIGARKIIVQVWPNATDRYGKEERAMVLALEIDPAEFTKVNWNNFSATDMLNLVEIQQLWPAMVPGIIEFCKDRGDAARPFCGQAARFIR
jgi:hypothetical protein